MNLSDQNRAKLDGIVHQMTQNGEPDTAIQAVVNDFKQKYGSPSFSGFVSNAIDSAGNAVNGFGQALLHPIDSISSVANVADGLAQKYIPGVTKIEQLGGTDPNVQAKQQQMAEAAVQNLKNRYGSLEAIKNTLYNDPVGAVVDAASIADPALKGVALAADAAKLGKVADVANAARALPGQVAGAVIGKAATVLQGSADAGKTKAFYDIINPTTKANKATVQDVVAPGLVERGVKASNLEDLQAQAQQHMADLGAKIDAVYDAKHKAGVTQSVWPILNKLEDYKQGVMAGPNKDVVLDPQLVSHVNNLQNVILDLGAKYPNGEIPLPELRQLRQVYDSKIAKVNGFALPLDELTKLEATKVLPDSIRQAIADNHPELADLNKEFSFWKRVDDTAGDTIQRRVGQREPLTNQIGMLAGEMIGSFLGQAVGGGKAGEVIGGAVGAFAGKRLSRITNSAAWKFVSPNAKQAVATALQRGNTQGALQLANQAVMSLSRANAINNVSAPQL